MARPLSPSDPRRSGTNGHSLHSLALDEAVRGGAGSHRDLLGEGETDDVQELLHLRSENSQLRTLCAELEQALHEATQQGGTALGDERMREYEALLEEKSEMIRALHHELQQAKAALTEKEPEASPPAARPAGPTPREEELLALSEELERERRQLQEDEQTLMEQMRQMEMSMARERAEMARQRNDLQRLQNEIMHEIERAERNGALVDRIKDLKDKLQDATNRRGAAPAASAAPPPSSAPAPKTPAPPTAPSKKEGLLGRWFGKDK